MPLGSNFTMKLSPVAVEKQISLLLLPSKPQIFCYDIFSYNRKQVDTNKS
jgi:hypothetical protein